MKEKNDKDYTVDWGRVDLGIESGKLPVHHQILSHREQKEERTMKNILFPFLTVG